MLKIDWCNVSYKKSTSLYNEYSIKSYVNKLLFSESTVNQNFGRGDTWMGTLGEKKIISNGCYGAIKELIFFVCNRLLPSSLITLIIVMQMKFLVSLNMVQICISVCNSWQNKVSNKAIARITNIWNLFQAALCKIKQFLFMKVM